MLIDNRLQSKTEAAELLFLRNTFLFSVFRQEYEFRGCSLRAFFESAQKRAANTANLMSCLCTAAAHRFCCALDGQRRFRLPKRKAHAYAANTLYLSRP